MSLRLAFMGTPDFALPVLQAVREVGHQVVAIYTQPPKPRGRGQQVQPSPVQAAGDAAGIPVYHPSSFRIPTVVDEFIAHGVDAAVVVAYGLILPAAVLASPRYGCLNLHFSRLPRWRGAAPVEYAILAGDRDIGVGVMQMATGLDTGAVWLEKIMPLTDADTAASLYPRLAEIGAALMVETLASVAAGTLRPTPQPQDGITIAKKIPKSWGVLDWRQAASRLAAQVRALDNVWFEHNGQRLRVQQAAVVERSGQPGLILDNALTIACGQQALAVMRLQRPGGKVLPVSDFLRGYPLPAGTLLPLVDCPLHAAL